MAIDHSKLTRSKLNTTTPLPPLLTLFLSACLTVASTGCAIQTPHLAITQFPVERQAIYFRDPHPYHLLVLPLSDQRPAEERQGKQAPAMFLVLWNRRVGDYATGDHVFGEHVSRQLSEQVARYLHASNLFADVTALPAVSSGGQETSASALRRLGAEHGADFLLGGELQHFYGSQHQQFSMFVLPLYFINTFGWQNGKGLPWGKTTIRFTLSDGSTGDLAWAQVIEADATLPRETDSMAEAAMEAFLNTAGQLTTQLRQLPLESLHAPQQKFGGDQDT